jgi:hypothetical protein
MRNRPPSLFVQANPLKPQNQVAVLATMVAGPAGSRGGQILRTHGPGLGRKAILHTYKHGVPALVNYYALKPTLPALRGDRKVGIRFGADRVMPMGAFGGPLSMYVLPSMRKLPIPIFGFGFTAVPMDENRVFHNPLSKSRGGEDATSTGTPRSTRTASKTIDGPLAKPIRGYPDRPRRGASATDWKGAGRPSKGKRRSRWNSEPVTPYCWRHKKRHYCKYTK